MEIIIGILALLGLGGLSLTLVWLLFALFNLLWAILSAVLATRRGRNAWNWFFLTCFYGIFGLLFLACSRTINQGECKESDTLSKVLWIMFFIPVILVSIFLVIASIEKKDEEELDRIWEEKEQLYHQNIDIIQQNEGVSEDDAKQILKDLELD